MPKNNPIAALTGDVLTATLSAQSLGLTVLLAEMKALSDVLPGVFEQMPPRSEPVGAADEAVFDNMPV